MCTWFILQWKNILVKCRYHTIYLHLMKWVVICHAVSTIHKEVYIGGPSRLCWLVCSSSGSPFMEIRCHNLLSYPENTITHSEIMEIHLEGVVECAVLPFSGIYLQVIHYTHHSHDLLHFHLTFYNPMNYLPILYYNLIYHNCIYIYLLPACCYI